MWSGAERTSRPGLYLRFSRVFSCQGEESKLAIKNIFMCMFYICILYNIYLNSATFSLEIPLCIANKNQMIMPLSGERESNHSFGS